MNLRSKAEGFANVFSAVPYRFENGPVSQAASNWSVEGLNCQLLFHLLCLEFFNIILPRYLRSSELFADEEWFIEKSLETVAEGDLIFMGPRLLRPQSHSEDSDAKKLHLALVIEVGPHGVYLLHATPNKGINISTMREVKNLTRGGKKPYEKVFGVKGLRI